MRFIFPTIFTSPQTFTSSGSWEVPDGITNICIEAWGRGGESGRVKNYNYHTNIYAGAGGGGAYGYECFSVSPGTLLNITIDGSGSSENNLILAGAGGNGTDAEGKSDGNHIAGVPGLGVLLQQPII